MLSVKAVTIPENGYLNSYRDRLGCYTDCFTIEVRGQVTLSNFISAFFDTFPFRLERKTLAVFALSPSSLKDVTDLATGVSDSLALWKVEARDGNQLIMSFGRRGVRTWLMVEPCQNESNTSILYFGTGLYFGSTVIPRKNKPSEEPKLSTVFYPFLGCHRLYARFLLWSAKRKIESDASSY